MPTFRKVVRNVATESKKIGYDPEIGTNWCHLPMEMRMKCIEPMDYTTRTRLGGTSTIEKSLVSSRKYHFDRVYVHNSSREIKVAARNTVEAKNRKEFDYNDSRAAEKRLECALSMLKSCDIKSFKFDDHGVFEEMDDAVLARFAALGPFSFRRFRGGGMSLKGVQMFLENCGPLERMTLSLFGPHYPYEGIVGIPAVVNVPELRLTHSPPCLHPLWDLVRKWIENDAEIGKSLQFVSLHRTVISFASKFKDRIVEKTGNKEVRIRMDNDAKQILLRLIGKHFRDGDHGLIIDEYMSCKVIAADLPKEEYASGDKWINNFHIANDAHLSWIVPYELDSDDSEEEESEEEEEEESEEEEEEDEDSRIRGANSHFLREPEDVDIGGRFAQFLRERIEEEEEEDEDEEEEEEEDELDDRINQIIAQFLRDRMIEEDENDSDMEEEEDEDEEEEFDLLEALENHLRNEGELDDDSEEEEENPEFNNFDGDVDPENLIDPTDRLDLLVGSEEEGSDDEN